MAEFWFTKDKKTVSGAVFETVKAIQQDQHGLRNDWLRYSSLYRGFDVNGFGPGEWNTINEDNPTFATQIGWNVVRAVVDTLLAKVTLQKPSIKFQTTNAPEIQQSTARWMEQYSLGALKFTDTWYQQDKQTKHAIIYGNGYTKVWAAENSPQVRAIHPSRITIDDIAALDSPPRSMFHTEYMSRMRLMELFPGAKREIQAADTFSTSTGGGDHFRDLIEVIEAWNLPSGSKPGLHVICVEGGENGVLLFEPYFKESFPFSFMRFSDPEQGWHGMSMIGPIESCQVEIDRILEKISGSLEHLANAFIFKQTNAEILDKDLLTNDWYKIIEGLQPPTIVTPPAVHPQVIEYLNLQWQRAFELSGISQLNATSSNPALPRLDSADALQFFQDIQTERFSKIVGERDRSLERIVVLLLRAGKELRGKWKVKGFDKEFLRMIDWNDIDLEEENFALNVSTINALPNHPSGRRAEVNKLAQAGLITREVALQLLDIPDLQKHARYANAPIEDLEYTMEHMLDKHDYIAPMPFQNLKLGIQIGQNYWLRHRMEGASQEGLDLIARWIQEASDMLTPVPEQPTLAPSPNPLEGLPASPAAAQQLSQAAATLPA